MPTLSESASKALIARAGVPVLDERTAPDVDGAVVAADAIGYPVVAKLCGDTIAHKTERGLVRLGLADATAVRTAATELLAAARPDDGPVEVLVAPMVRATRELIAGLLRDPQFGPCVMLGVGGVLAEAIGDVVFRLTPITLRDAHDMIDDLATQKLLERFRGEPAVDRDALARVLVGLSKVVDERPDIVSVDVNPILVADGMPVAVDALVEIGGPAGPAAGPGDATPSRPRPSDEEFRALFEPRGVIVAGASSHPGKFGFVALHNVLASGYRGAVAATNLDGGTVLGIHTVRSVDDLPADTYDLAVVCTPAGANPELLRACARRGVRAAFVTSAGYREAGADGRAAEDELVALADELGILLAGPNGQGVVSTPASLCAQIVAPYPPRGSIGVASQSGNFVSSFLNYARFTGVGISRAVSAGNAAAVSVADYLDFYADDPDTNVGLAYLEGVGDGRALFERLRSIAQRQPLVVLKGGTTAGGSRAAASHTGSLATDTAVFDGACRQAGITRAATVEEAFEAAATFATQPRPRGPRTIVITTAGGWGVVTADAISRSALELVALPDDLRDAIDGKLPPRWSRNNPIDLAGGETRDTIPEVLALVAEHDAVDAIIYLGLGIQSNQARLLREGGFFPDHGLERIVAYHERQDARFAAAAAEISSTTGKPILTATELAIADPENAGPAAVRASGRVAYASADRAVRALELLWLDARFRARHSDTAGVTH
ncbi:MAG TPA: acetate--CoA ligase family protein [Acidimicrobiia bacterium]|nr:acetate--CoA ligase family protein [Acidimicrobiia bacterium]